MLPYPVGQGESSGCGCNTGCGCGPKATPSAHGGNQLAVYRPTLSGSCGGSCGRASCNGSCHSVQGATKVLLSAPPPRTQPPLLVPAPARRAQTSPQWFSSSHVHRLSQIAQSPIGGRVTLQLLPQERGVPGGSRLLGLPAVLPCEIVDWAHLDWVLFVAPGSHACLDARSHDCWQIFERIDSVRHRLIEMGWSRAKIATWNRTLRLPAGSPMNGYSKIYQGDVRDSRIGPNRISAVRRDRVRIDRQVARHMVVRLESNIQAACGAGQDDSVNACYSCPGGILIKDSLFASSIGGPLSAEWSTAHEFAHAIVGAEAPQFAQRGINSGWKWIDESLVQALSLSMIQFSLDHAVTPQLLPFPWRDWRTSLGNVTYLTYPFFVLLSPTFALQYFRTGLGGGPGLIAALNVEAGKPGRDPKGYRALDAALQESTGRTLVGAYTFAMTSLLRPANSYRHVGRVDIVRDQPVVLGSHNNTIGGVLHELPAMSAASIYVSAPLGTNLIEVAFGEGVRPDLKLRCVVNGIYVLDTGHVSSETPIRCPGPFAEIIVLNLSFDGLGVPWSIVVSARQAPDNERHLGAAETRRIAPAMPNWANGLPPPVEFRSITYKGSQGAGGGSRPSGACAGFAPTTIVVDVDTHGAKHGDFTLTAESLTPDLVLVSMNAEHWQVSSRFLVVFGWVGVVGPEDNSPEFIVRPVRFVLDDRRYAGNRTENTFPVQLACSR